MTEEKKLLQKIYDANISAFKKEVIAFLTKELLVESKYVANSKAHIKGGLYCNFKKLGIKFVPKSDKVDVKGLFECKSSFIAVNGTNPIEVKGLQQIDVASDEYRSMFTLTKCTIDVQEDLGEYAYSLYNALKALYREINKDKTVKTVTKAKTKETVLV